MTLMPTWRFSVVVVSSLLLLPILLQTTHSTATTRYTPIPIAFQTRDFHSRFFRRCYPDLSSPKIVSALLSSSLSLDNNNNSPLSTVTAATSSTAAAGGGGGSSSSKTETVRLPAGQLFEQRHYIFTTIRNIRSYEWTTKETEELYDDIADEVFFRSRPRSTTQASAEATTTTTNDETENESTVPNPRDFELQQIVLVPATWDTKRYGLGNIYDIYDGQQRLVTFSLLYAALRDSLRIHVFDENDIDEDDDDSNSQAAAYETIQELADMLNPPRSRKEPILRIQLRQREGTVLRTILLPELTDDGRAVKLPPCGSKCRSNLTKTDQLVLNNYELLLHHVNELSLDDKLKLTDYLQENVYFLVCSSHDASIARNMVMGQGKGKNNEPIDDFKGLVCFRTIVSEDHQDQVFAEWDDLASSDEGVGRDHVAAACQLLASAQLRKKIKKNDEIDVMEEWLKMELETTYRDGRDFFYNVIDPACRTLKDFRDGAIDVSSFPGARGDHRLQRSLSMMLAFLRALSSVARAKEIEIAVLHQLMQQDLSAEALEFRLKQFELAALYMVLIKPSPTKRHRLVFDLLDSLATVGEVDQHTPLAIRELLSISDLVQMRNALDTGEFGLRSPGTTVAVALLVRVNAEKLCKHCQSSVPQCTALQLEHILPKKADDEYWKMHWDAAARAKSTHRLGNLTLMNQKANVKASNKSFTAKKDEYKESPYTLTSSLQKYDVWNEQAFQDRHKEILHFACDVWGL